jgi:hypothetical protein
MEKTVKTNDVDLCVRYPCDTPVHGFFFRPEMKGREPLGLTLSRRMYLSCLEYLGHRLGLGNGNGNGTNEESVR